MEKFLGQMQEKFHQMLKIELKKNIEEGRGFRLMGATLVEKIWRI